MRTAKELLMILGKEDAKPDTPFLYEILPDIVNQLIRLREAETNQKAAMSLLIDASADTAIDIYWGSAPPFTDEDSKYIFCGQSYIDAWEYAKRSMLDYLFPDEDDDTPRGYRFERKHERWYDWLAKFTCALSKLYGRRLEHIAIWTSIGAAKAKAAAEDKKADEDEFQCTGIGCIKGCTQRATCPEHM